MKNRKLFKLLLISFFYFVPFFGLGTTEEITINSSELDIAEGGKILSGKNGFDAMSGENFIISGKDFLYDKNLNKFSASDNVSLNDIKKDIKINAEKLIYFKKEEKIIFEDNVVLIDNKKNILINAEKLIYFKNDEKVIFENKSNIYYKNKFEILTSNLVYLKDKKEIISDYNSIFTDKSGNKLTLDKFHLDIEKNIVSGKDIELTDNELNKYFIENLKYSLNDKSLFGKDFYLVLNNENPNEGDYRLKGRTIYHDNKSSVFEKGVFTTCKKTDDCPPWLFQAEKIEHDKKNQLIKYKNAWLKIYDMPIFYFPKFFHPDPTVKRQSGFLIPTFADSTSLGASLTLPYYKVLSESKDLTFKPRIFNNKTIFQTEYRMAKKNSLHVADFSYFNHDVSSRSHFFLNSNYKLESKRFDNSTLEFNVESTNNDTYLKTYNISSPIINSKSVLSSYLDYKAYNEDSSLNIYTKVIEDLNKNDDRYEYIYPYVNFSKSFKKMQYTLTGYNKKFNTNQDSTNITNNLLYSSEDSYALNGLKKNWKVLFKNVNSKRNKTTEKNGENYELYSGLFYDLNLPLVKKGEKFDKIIDPMISFRYSPNKNNNISNDERRMDFDNIFTLDRISSNETVEGGESITFGADYKFINNKSLDEVFKIGIAQVFRNQENKDLPRTSSIGETRSDILGNLAFYNNDFIDLKYDFSFDNNLNDSKYNNINLNVNVNKFVTSFEYLDDDISSDTKNFLSSSIKYNANDNHSILFNRRENKKTGLTEYNNLIYEYKNDCLKAGIEYKKKYYSDGDTRPGEELMFTVTLGTFGTIYSPAF